MGVNADEGKLTLTLSNNLPAINRSAKISYGLFDSLGNKLLENSFDLEKMAPKTGVKVPIKWYGTTVLSGKYTLKVDYPISDTQAETVSREFTINQNEANNIITETPLPEATGKIGGNYSGIVILLIIIIILLMVLLKKNRKYP